MQKLDNEKGITLATLVITIIVLLMISTPIAINFTNIGKVRKYTSFKDDIDNLRENIDIAYRENDDLSTIGPEYEGSLSMLENMQGTVKVKNDNDNDKYYVIDLEQLNKRLRVKIGKLNYGQRNQYVNVITDDVYIINERSKTIYYVKGVEYKGIVYHRLHEEFSSRDDVVNAAEEIQEMNTVYIDKYGSKAIIPVGYAISQVEDEQIISKGLVIKDKQGNEFVWIPTKSFYDDDRNEINMSFDRDSFGSQAKGGKDDTTDSEKIYNDGDSTYYFYEKMNEQEKKSVADYGGFYIGRYETTRVDTTILVQANKPIYNETSKEQAVTIANNFARNDNVTSRLCSSYAWDTTLKFIEESGNDSYLTDEAKGNHGNAINLSGASNDKINNIYDLGGNVYEWTLENTSKENLSVVRGGAISSSDTAITRKTVSDDANANIGFRITLFIK